MKHIAGFIVWCFVGCIFIGRGIYALFAKKPVGFNLRLKIFITLDINTVTDIKRFNRAAAFLYIVYGIGYVLLGIPMLLNIAWALLSLVGVLVLTVGVMAIFSNIVENKYWSKK